MENPDPTTPDCEKCSKVSAVHVYQVSGSRITEERHFCAACATRHLWIPSPTPATAFPQPPGTDEEIPTEVERILFSGSQQQYVILKDARGRRLTLVVGYFEAMCLWWYLHGEPINRPVTHAGWLNTISALGWQVESACVHDRDQEAYLADLRLCRAGVRATVDIRPSDALVLALRASLPLLFKDRLLARYGVSQPEPR